MKQSIILYLGLMFFSFSSQAKDIALVVGGGADDNADFVVPPANNWYHGLKNLGWDVEVFFGDEFSSFQKITSDQQLFLPEKVLTRLQEMKESMQDGDNLFFILITHGTRCTRFNPVTIEDELQSEQVVASAGLATPMQPLLLELSKIDEKNGQKGKVVFWNHSCFSGAAMEDLNRTGICALTISGENQRGKSGTSAIGSLINLLSQEEYIRIASPSGGVKETPVHRFMLNSLLEEFLPLDPVTPAMYSNGFGLNLLNVENHSTFLNRFSTLFPGFRIPKKMRNRFGAEPTKNEASKTAWEPSQIEKNMLSALKANKALMRQLELEDEDLAISYARRGSENNNISNGELLAQIRAIREFSGGAAGYYEIITEMADWLSYELKLSAWTMLEIRERIIAKPIDYSSFLVTQDYDYRESMRVLYPLLTDHDLKVIRDFTIQKNTENLSRIFGERDPQMTDVDTKQAKSKPIEQLRNELLGYAFSKNKTDCGTFNLKRK